MTMKMKEMVFFDVETASSPPSSSSSSSSPDHRRWWLVEFGAILVCPKRLIEVDSYETFIRPGDLSAASKRFADIDGACTSAPPFEDVADDIFAILDGRVWAGHNIQRFDCPRIREAFADIGRPAPEPVGVIDSLNVLAQEFGRRAGDLKMATLASYFGIGKQTHRSLDDARMNLEVLKHCATVLLLESTLPAVLCSDVAEACTADGAVTRRRAHNRTKSYSRSTSTTTNTLHMAFARARASSAAMKTTAIAPPLPAAAAAAVQKIGSCKKRDSMGKVVVVEKAGNGKSTTSSGGRRPTTPFSMMLRHSRAIVR